MGLELLLVAVLVNFRLSHLVAREGGPWKVFDRFRTLCGARWNQEASGGRGEWQAEGFAELVCCPYCSSVWLAAGIVGWIVLFVPTQWFMVPLWAMATSGATCMVLKGLDNLREVGK